MRDHSHIVRHVARQAQRDIRQMPVSDRLDRIRRLRALIVHERESIIDRVQAETGKCRNDALMSEIFPVLDHLHYLEKTAVKALTRRKVRTPIALLGKKSEIHFDPLGVVFVISPWNYPFFQAVVPCTAAFVAGNAVVYKPSEHTPLQGLFESLLTRAGFVDGWIQVIYGDGSVAENIIDARPDKIFFTGSVGTGKKIMAQAAKHLIPVELELGGKDPMIVFEDANLDRATAGALWGAMTNCGQSCTSVESVFVEESVYEAFKRKLLERVAQLKQEVDNDGDSDVGHMTVDFQSKVVADHLVDAEEKGAILLSGGSWDRTSRAIPPLVIENTTEKMKVVTEETFGPVLPLIPFRTEEEVISRVNALPFGLSASVWSRDKKRAMRVATLLHTGNVSINNVMLTEANPALPFGGVKNSGFGRYKGEIGLQAFCNIKSILIDSDSAKIEANWYPYTGEKYRLFSSMMVSLFSGGLLNFLRFVFHGLRLETYSNKASRGQMSQSKAGSMGRNVPRIP